VSEKRYEIPAGVEVATQWAWRVLVIGAAGLALLAGLRYFSEITVPIAVALLGAALLNGSVDWLDAHRVPRVLAALLVVVALVAVLAGLVTLVGQQLSTQFDDVRSNVVEGISQVQDWAQGPPLNLSDVQIQSYIDSAKETIASSDTAILAQVGAVGTTVGHVFAGFFIAVFTVFFFLFEGNRIWSWLVALFPRDTRDAIDSSGRTAWTSLTRFVRATVVVALVDAIGIAFFAWVLNVPLTLAIGVLVFLGAFVPVVGALVSGLVAVLIALVAQGPVVAALMLLAVVLVQQIESHVLQPFLMGRFVAVHPLAIILAIAAGISVAGIVGALIAVPLAACLNGVVLHLVDRAQPFQAEPEPDPVPVEADDG
jgi:predicted PurR-regulated permease PerM